MPSGLTRRGGAISLILALSAVLPGPGAVAVPSVNPTALQTPPTVNPRTVPGAPMNVGATVSNRSATVSWSKPITEGGSSITGYTAIAQPGGKSCTAGRNATSCTITDLIRGRTYIFSVFATNSEGNSAPSITTPHTIPSSVPGPPTNVQASPGVGIAVVSWEEPANDSGKVITGYTATASPGGQSCTAGRNATSCTVGNLTPGTAYTFTVVATNALGDSAASDPSPSVTIRRSVSPGPGGGGSSGGGSTSSQTGDPVQPVTPTVIFSDIPPDAPYRPHVNHIAQLGITIGYTDGTYRPHQPITRAQMATFLSRAIGNPPQTTTTHFTDIPPDAPYRPHVNHIAQLGITIGYTDGTYRPHQPITRAQMATFLSRAIGNPPQTTTTHFTDIPPDAPYRPHVNHIAQLGITVGHADGTYRPHQPITRAQMATFLSRAIVYLATRSDNP